MKYKLGDFVRFVDERMEGYITKIISPEMVAVTGEDDFEIPVLTNKITFVHGQTPTERLDEPGKDVVINAGEFVKNGVTLAIAPDLRKGSVVHFHLVNDTSFQLLATLTTEKTQQFKGEFSGIIMPQSSVQVYSGSLPDLDLWPTFHIQILYFSKSDVKPLEPIITKEKFKAKDFSGSKKLVKSINQQAWIIPLDEIEVAIDAEKLKESFFRPSAEKQTIDKPLKEIDLHIEKLQENYQSLSNSEIMEIQMAHFKKALDASIVHKLPTVTFIHGVGNGTLKNQIHKALGKHPQVKTFMDAWKEKFGFGATEVILK